MKKRSIAVFLAAVFVLALSAAGGADVTSWKNPQPALTGASPEETAALFLAGHGGLYRAGDIGELEWLETHMIGGVSYVRFQQARDGLPVEGAQAVVTVDRTGAVHQLSDGTVRPDLLPGPQCFITGEDAERIAASGRPDLAADGTRGPVYIASPEDGAGAYLAMAVRVERKDPWGIWEVFVDCSRRRPVFVRSLLIRADGNVYDPNPVVNPAVQRVTLEHLTSATNLQGDLAEAFACADSRCDTVVQRAEADGEGNFLYDPVEPSIEDAFSEVNGYYHLTKINSWFETEMGFLKSCGGSRRMNILVNLDYPNAFYGDIDGDRCGDVTLGQDTAAPGIDFAYDGDVIYHEFTHGVVEDTAGLRGATIDELGFDFSSGGLNEGTADYYAVTVTDDPVLGDYALGSYGGELMARNAENDNVCPGDLTGESHMDGEIWTGTLWEIRTAIGAHKTDELALAVLYSLTSQADFDEAGNALVTQASVLEGDGTLDPGDAAVVESIADARGLIGCERIIFLEDGDTGLLYTVGTEEWGGWIDYFTSGVELAIEAPPGAVRVIVRFTTLSVGADYDVYVKENSPVTYTREHFSAIPDDYDYIFEGTPRSAAWTTFSDPVITPDTTYFMSILSRSAYGLLLSYEATVVVSDLPDPAPDTADAVEDVVEEEVTTEDAVEDLAGEDEDAAGPDAEDDARDDPSGDAEQETPDGKITSEGCGCAVVR